MKKITTPLLAIALCSVLHADVVHNDDVIITHSECIGNDCVDGESFGFDTLRLKENNLRINFDDTSASSSFPNNDWQITINDSANGGVNKFSIDDITGGRTPFTIEAAAPSHSLYVDSSGKVGIGTSTPLVEMHNKSNDTPILRLEQDGSAGWSPQTWDVAGNEANFFVRDVTNGSKLPFRIRPGAPTSSIDILASGNVGLGTSTAHAKLDVTGSAIINGELNTTNAITIAYSGDYDKNLNKLFTMSQNNTQVGKFSDAGFIIENKQADFQWVFRSYNEDSNTPESFSISKVASGGKELIVTGLDSTGGMKLILGNGAMNTGGQWLDASSRAYKENIKDLDEKTAMEAFAKLEPVTYNYKTNKNEPIVGFIAEDVPDVVASNTRDTLSALELVALLTKVVQVQEKTLAETKAALKNKDVKISAMEKDIVELKKMKEKITLFESLLNNIAINLTTKEKGEVSVNLQ